MPSNPPALFDEFRSTWCDDFIFKAQRERGIVLTESQQKTMVLQDIDQRLQSYEKNLALFGLPVPSNEELAEIDFVALSENAVVREELDFIFEDLRTTVETRVPSFTPEQATVFETVVAAVRDDVPIQVFIDARGGCGKTYLLNTILAEVRTLQQGGCVAIAMATTGIAANLLDLGQTSPHR